VDAAAGVDDSRNYIYSVGAVVRPVIWPVIRAIQAVAIKAAANETTSSGAEVIVTGARHMATAKSADVATAKSADVGSAHAAHVATAEAASTKAAHMASAATAAVSTTTAAATATARFCARSKKAPGKHRACQNHHHSSSHDILHLIGGRSALGFSGHRHASAK
jgi:hypothetical protein